jgi:hypothetical protein
MFHVFEVFTQVTYQWVIKHFSQMDAMNLVVRLCCVDRNDLISTRLSLGTRLSCEFEKCWSIGPISRLVCQRRPKWRGWQFHGSWLHMPLLLPHMLTVLIRLMMWMSLTFCLWSASKCHIAITLPDNHRSLTGTCLINWRLLYRWGHNTGWLMMLISTARTSEEDHHKSTCEDNQQKSIICVVPVILEIR